MPIQLSETASHQLKIISSIIDDPESKKESIDLKRRARLDLAIQVSALLILGAEVMITSLPSELSVSISAALIGVALMARGRRHEALERRDGIRDEKLIKLLKIIN